MIAHAHDAFVVLCKVSLAISSLLALGLMIHYAFWPEWEQDTMLIRLLARYPRSEYVTRYVEDHTVREWESSEAYRQMVLDACERLHKDSIGHRFTANEGADRSVIYDVSADEYERLLREDPDAYE